VWNSISGGSPNVSGLVDSFGAATSVGIDINSRGAFGTANSQGELSAAVGLTPLIGDYLSSRANNSQADVRTGQINGLIAGNAYDFYVYGQGDNFGGGQNGGQNVGIRIGTDVRHTSYDGTPGGDGLLVEDIEYVVFRGIIADANGEINFEHFNPGQGTLATDTSFFDSSTGLADADNNPSRFHAINGIQIVGNFTEPEQVPEPSALAGLSLLALGLFTRRQRS